MKNGAGTGMECLTVSVPSKLCQGSKMGCTWPSEVVLPSRRTLMSMSDPSVYAPKVCSCYEDAPCARKEVKH